MTNAQLAHVRRTSFGALAGLGPHNRKLIMIRKLSLATAFLSAFALPAAAADRGSAPAASDKPAAVAVPSPVDKDVSEITKPAATVEGPVDGVDSIMLTAAQGNAWIDKSVYSSDGQNLGEVVSFQRNGNNRVIGLQADIGGFLGMGETRIAVKSSQFTLEGDRVVLGLTAAQAKDLPKIAM